MLLPLDEDEEWVAPAPAPQQSIPAPQQPAPAPQQSAPVVTDALLFFDDDAPATAASSSGEPCQPARKPPPPPRPPPPPKSKAGDLDEVWTPLQDSSIQGCLAKEKTGDMLLGTDAAMAAVLFGVDAPLQAEVGVNLLDLEDSGLPAPDAPAEDGGDSAGRAAGLFADVPDYVAKSLEGKKRTMLDLSDPAEQAAEEARRKEREEKDRQRRQSAGGGASSSTTTASRGPAKAIPTDAKGFGSDDIFGKRSEDRNLQEHVVDEATSAYNSVKGMLPQNVQEQMPSCTAPPVADDETEIVIQEAPPVNGLAPQRPEPNSLEAEHEQAAINRALEGRWVPTYMRAQLAANGHTDLPRSANAHEFNASAPPPSLTNAVQDMAGEIGEQAQTVFEFFASFLSVFTLQCQVCGVQTASTVHDQVMTYGDNLCSGGHGDAATELEVGRPGGESTAAADRAALHVAEAPVGQPVASAI